MALYSLMDVPDAALPAEVQGSWGQVMAAIMRLALDYKKQEVGGLAGRGWCCEVLWFGGHA